MCVLIYSSFILVIKSPQSYVLLGVSNKWDVGKQSSNKVREACVSHSLHAHCSHSFLCSIWTELQGAGNSSESDRCACHCPPYICLELFSHHKVFQQAVLDVWERQGSQNVAA